MQIVQDDVAAGAGMIQDGGPVLVIVQHGLSDVGGGEFGIGELAVVGGETFHAHVIEPDGWKRLDKHNLSVTYITHTGLTDGVEYWYTYRSNYSDFTGAWSHYANIMFSNAPASFSPPTVAAQLAGQDINVKWNEVQGATHYRMACWPCSDDGGWTVFDWAEQSFNASIRPKPSITYWFAVQARNAAGDLTAWSKQASVETSVATPTGTPVPDSTSTPTPTSTPTGKDYDRWLPGITIAPERQCTRYIDAIKSYGWNGRSQRALDLRNQIVNAMGGRIYDPYTGQYFGDIWDMSVEHHVDSEEAHMSGMCHENRKQQRPLLTYDVENAVLADFRRLSGHSIYGPDEWLPRFNKCWYVNQYVHIKRKYGLTMDKSEADAAIEVLSGCSSTELVFSVSPTPTPTIVTNDPLHMYDDDNNGRISCAEARRHGIAPVYSLHPAYPYMDDPDGNGIACE